MLHPPLDNWNHTTLPALCKLFFFFCYKYCFVRKLYFQNSSSVTRHIQRSPGENKEGELIGLSRMLKDLQISKLECFPNQEDPQSQTTSQSLSNYRNEIVFPQLFQNSFGLIQLYLQMTVDQTQTSLCMFVFQAYFEKLRAALIKSSMLHKFGEKPTPHLLGWLSAHTNCHF